MAQLKIVGRTRQEDLIEFQEISEFSYESDRFTPADQMTCTVLDDLLGKQIIEVAAYRDGVLFFDGIADVQKTVRGSNGRWNEFVCRSWSGAMMLDNEARPQTNSFLTAGQLFGTHAQPFGVKGFRFPEQTMIPEFLIQKGSSHWEVLCLFCRRAFETSPYLDRENYLSLQPFTGKQLTFSNDGSQGIPFQKMELTEDRSRMISKLWVKTGTTDSGAYYGGSVVNHLAQGMRIYRERYYNPGKQWGGQLPLSAKTLIKEHQLDFWCAELTLPGLYDIHVGDCAQILEDQKQWGGLYVSQVKMQLSPDGMLTRVRLWDAGVL